jgi:hypothetical protein
MAPGRLFSVAVLTADPHDASVRETVGDTICTTEPEIDLRISRPEAM